MKTLYNTIQESLLSDIDTTLARGAYDIMLNNLFSTNLQQRREVFDELRLLVESYHPKRHMTTSKMKNSDSYFIEFTRPFKIENGLARDICDYISYITICKKNGSLYKNIIIGASNDMFGDKVGIYEWNWTYTRSEFNPKAANSKLYEVPEELNSLFERIEMEAYKHCS